MNWLRLLVVPLALGTLVAQTLEIGPAVELAFEAVTGKGYQLRASDDLTHWRPAGGPLLALSGSQTTLLPAAETNRYFQLSSHDVRDLNGLLEPIRVANGVPALACAVVVSNRIVGLGAVGLRKAGVTNAPVTLQDRWHHGSLTKSVTATLAGILVEAGKIRWDTTLAEVFPQQAAKMNAAWRTVTLDWLCSNRGGAPGDLGPSGIWSQLSSFGGTPTEGRRLLLEKLTALAPASTPGTKYEYSNAGFALAGHMLETVMGKSWEELVGERLFAPLDMRSGGFGVPATPRMINQPWGHQWAGGKPSPVEPGTGADNPSAIGPAGTVHCSVIDLAKYVAFHLAGEQGDTAMLTRATVQKLHTAPPNNGSYAYGWVASDRPWAGTGKALNHAGSNTQWYSVIWMAPARQFGVVALCNLATSSGANPGATATDQIAGKMIQEFLSQ